MNLRTGRSGVFMKISKQDLRRIVQKYTHVEEIENNMDIFESLKVDSVIFVQILVEVEELIGNELPTELLAEDKWRTIDIIYEELQKSIISRN